MAAGAIFRKFNSSIKTLLNQLIFWTHRAWYRLKICSLFLSYSSYFGHLFQLNRLYTPRSLHPPLRQRLKRCRPVSTIISYITLNFLFFPLSSFQNFQLYKPLRECSFLFLIQNNLPILRLPACLISLKHASNWLSEEELVCFYNSQSEPAS